MKARNFGIILFAVLLAAAALVPVPGRATGTVHAALDRPLRFAAPVALGTVRAARVEADCEGMAGGPVVVSGDSVTGGRGAVPAGVEVSVWWRGVEIGRAVAASDGSFAAPVPVLPDGRVTVVYGTGLPSLRPWVNVAACVWPSMTGGVSASGWYSDGRPECLFDGYVPAPGASVGTVWGAGNWGAGTSSVGWVERDLGRAAVLRRVLVWPAGLSTEQAWYRLDASGPSGQWSRESGWIKNVGYTGRMEPGTLGWQAEVPGGFAASRVKLSADLSYNWTGACELAVLADLPVEEALSAPAWTLPGGESLGSAPVSLVKPASWSGHNPAYWPDPEAWWVWCTPGANVDAPVGTVRFRAAVEVAEPTDAILYVAVDGTVTAWLDGVKILYWQAPNGYGATPLRLSPGKHVLAFECENVGASPNPAGFLVTLRDWVGNVILHSGGPGWETSGYVQ